MKYVAFFVLGLALMVAVFITLPIWLPYMVDRVGMDFWTEVIQR